MIKYEIKRAIIIKSLTEKQIEFLHNIEIKDGLKMASYYMPKDNTLPFNRIFSGMELTRLFKIRHFQDVKPKEYENIKDLIVSVIPRYKDEETQDYYTDQEFIHIWDWKIKRDCPEFNFKAESDLVNEVEAKSDWRSN